MQNIDNTNRSAYMYNYRKNHLFIVQLVQSQERQRGGEEREGGQKSPEKTHGEREGGRAAANWYGG